MKISLNNRMVEIDDEIVDLIKVLNRFNLKTEFCCSGHDTGEAYISFNLENITDINIRNNKLSVNWVFNEKKYNENKELINFVKKEVHKKKNKFKRVINVNIIKDKEELEKIKTETFQKEDIN